ncbi:MAG TPA: hypothetical protein VJ653_01160, partial [Acidimicrobiales bacterium]|nr:hypothetical protein [Acidimicrobiales bacterium]
EARSIIEELWAEREQARPTPPGQPAPAPAPPRPKAGSRERKLAAAVVLLLAGNGLGIGAKALGLVGAPPAATFVSEADAVCAPTNAQLSALPKPSGYASVAATASSFVAVADAQVRQLRGLQLPSFGDRGKAQAVLGALAATAAAGRRLQAAAATSDPAVTANASRTMKSTVQDAAAKGRALGLTACATGMQPGADALLAGANGAVKASLIEKGSALCADLFRSAEAFPEPKTSSEFKYFIEQVTTLYGRFVTGLKALPAPPGDEATVAELAAGVNALAGKVTEMGAAAVNGDRKRVDTIMKEGDALTDALGVKFDAYGLTDCGT